MRKLLLFLLLLSVAIVGAEEQINPNINFDVENPENLGITNPKVVSLIDIDFTESGILDVSGRVKQLNLELYSFPRDDYYSDVSSLSTTPTAIEKNEYYLFDWSSAPPGKTEYSLSSNVRSEFDVKKVSTSQPFPFTVPFQYKKYIDPSENINSDDPNIKKQANELVLGETDAYIAAYKLAKFVSDEMNYDISYLGRREPATIVLRDKIGVCVEYSTLFMALARSIGIPTRYVSGYAYGGVYGEKFNAHAWTEIYLPDAGWIPFDPTFGEFGWVDVTHIKTQIGRDPTEPSLRISWIGGDVTTTEPGTRVDLNKKEETLPKYIDNRLWVEKEEVGLNSYNIIWMSLENNQNFYLSPEAFLTAAPKIIGKNQKTAILPPSSSTMVGWIIQIPEDLDPNFMYTYTVNGNALFGEEKSVSFKVNPKSNDVLTLDEVTTVLGVEKAPTAEGFAPSLNVDIKVPEFAFLNENFTLTLDLNNMGNIPISDLKVCVENAGKRCENLYLGIGDNQLLTFSEMAGAVGTKKLFLTFSGDGVEESQVVEVEVRKRTITEWLDKLLSKLLSFFG